MLNYIPENGFVEQAKFCNEIPKGNFQKIQLLESCKKYSFFLLKGHF
jgi:hypothetical protein